MQSLSPILVISDAAARLVRRGLLDPRDPALARWESARVFVFLHGPVQYDLPARGREAVQEASSATALR